MFAKYVALRTPVRYGGYTANYPPPIKEQPMAIAINNHPSMLVANRNMAPIYRRRRAAVSLALAALAVTVSFAMLDTSAAADTPSVGDSVTPRVVVAQSGDTLWAIAKRLTPNGNITELVDQLVLMNGDSITPGQQIRIP